MGLHRDPYPLRRALSVASLAWVLLAGLTSVATEPSTATPADPWLPEQGTALPTIDLRGDLRASPHRDAARRQAYQRWPGRTIRFYSAMDETFDWSIEAGVAAWNQSGLRMAFKRVRSQRRAQLIIRPTGGVGIFGEATLGYNPWGGVRNNWVKLSKNALTDRGDSALLTPWQRRVVTANIVAHELGHTLGIDHQSQLTRTCGLMMPTLMIGTCDITGPEMGHYRCAMTDAWVLARTVRKYGGRKTPGTTFCPILPIPPAPSGLSISGGIEEDGPVLVSWVPPANVPLGTTMRVRVSSGDWCPARVERDDNLWPAWVEDETIDEYSVDPALGTWREPTDEWDTSHAARCFTARLTNEADGSAVPVSVHRTRWYPPPAAPTVTGVEHVGSDLYTVSLDPAETDDWSLEHVVLVHPEGQCGTEPITYPELLTSATRSLHFRSTLPRPCIRVVALRGQRVSPPTPWQVG